jgi:WD40 repeat protein/serine/threonine protein kinase
MPPPRCAGRCSGRMPPQPLAGCGDRPAPGDRFRAVRGKLQPDGLIGRRLGEFELLELIGQGSFGLVFRAAQAILEREAVVKVARFSGTDAIASKAVAKFLAEARLASRIDHPFAAHVYAFGAEPDGLLWIAMEFVRGTPLDRLLRQQGPMPLERAIPLIRRLCEVVHTAHEQGIVHRDLKPANVMVVARAGTLFPKLLDLGVARDVTSGVAERSGPLGTPLYMAPEQWVNAGAVTRAADIYALGALTYEVLTGTSPFKATTMQEVAAHHAFMEPPALPPELPEALSDAIIHALAKKAADRFPTALAFSEAMLATSGISADSFNLPGLDELTRDEVLVHGPQPIAEAVSAYEAARTPALARAALWQTSRVIAKYVGLVALACRSRTGSGRLGDAPAVLELLGALRKKSLDTGQWWRLARELCRPFATFAEIHPIPELVGLFFEQRAELKTPMDLLLDSRAREPADDAPPDEVRGFLLGAVPALASTLRALRFLHEYKLVVPQDDRDELWMGVRRPIRTATHVVRPHSLTSSIAAASVAGLAAMRAGAGDPTVEPDGGEPVRPGGERLRGRVTSGPGAGPMAVVATERGTAGQHDASRPLLIGSNGIAVVSLWPLIQVEPPSPGYPPELFMLDGHGRHGARLLSVSDRLERSDEAVWPQLGLGSIDAELSGSMADDDAPPYRGLSTFTEADAGRFFGREREVEGFVNRLATMPLIAVVGPSGAGKSSFVQAGVLPTLGPDWVSLVVRPGPTPLATMCALVAGLGVAVTPAQVRGEPRALGVALRAHADAIGKSLLLVVDQFEELVTLCLDGPEQETYAAALTQIADDDTAPVRVVITMRDDFMVRVAQLTALRQRLATSLQILTTPVPADLLRILKEPARRAGYAFEDDALPQEMVDEVADQPAALALLSFTAYQLWQFRDRHFKQLPRKAYKALGGVGGALAQHAEATLDGMDDRERAVVREVFRHLVTAGGTRAVLSRAELLQVAGGAAAGGALEKLIQARLLVAMDSVTGERIEVVHEALLAAWPRLVRWRQEDAEGARLRDQLRVAARQWADRGRTRDLLWRGKALAEYELWRARYPGALTTLEEDFGRQSLAAARRGRHLRRGVLVVIGTGLVVALVIFARLRSQAEHSRARAHAAELDASRRLTQSLYEHGRRALLESDNASALLYLNEAFQRGVDTPALRYMLGRGLRSLGEGVLTLRGNAGAFSDLTYAPDGKAVVAMGDDGAAQLWDVATGAPTATLAGHSLGGRARVRWAADGASIVTADFAGVVRVWTTTGAHLHEYTLPDSGVYGFALTPDSRAAVSWAASGVINVTDLATGKLLHAMAPPGPGYSVRGVLAPAGGQVLAVYERDGESNTDVAVTWTPATDRRVVLQRGPGELEFGAFAPDGARVAIAEGDHTIGIWDTATGRLTGRLRGHDELVDIFAWAPDGNELASGDNSGAIKLWDPKTGAIRAGLTGHTGQITEVRYSPDGKLLLSTSVDGSVRVWDVARALPLATYMQGGSIYMGVFRSDGRQVATSSLAGTVKLWPLSGFDLERTLVGAPNDLWQRPQVSADGTQALLASRTGGELWDVRDGHLLELPTGTVAYDPVMSQQGARVAIADGDGRVHVFERDGRLVRTWRAAPAPLAVYAIDPAGERVATSAPDGALATWAIATGAQLASRQVAPSSDLLWSPAGGQLLLIGEVDRRAGVALLLDATTLAPLAELGSDVFAARFSPSGTEVAITSFGVTLRIATLGPTGPTGWRELKLPAQPFSLTWTPDGSTLLVGQADGGLSIWSTRDGRRLALLHAHDVEVLDVAVSASGEFAVTTAAGGRVATWDLRAYQAIFQFRAGRDVRRTRFVDGDARIAASDGQSIEIWSSSSYAGTPTQLAADLACRLSLRLEQGTVVPAQVLAGCGAPRP